MRTNVFRAAMVASVVLIAAIASTGAASKKAENELTASPAVVKILAAVQKLVAVNDFRTAMDQLRAAQALPNRTPEDDYLINQFIAAASIRLNDMPTATTAFEALADSPLLQRDPNKVQVLSNAMIVENVSKRYQKTIAYAQALQAIQPLNDAQNTSLAEAYYFTNDFAHMKELGQKVIAASKAAGAMPPKGVLQMLMNSDLNTGDKAGAEAISEELAVDYNVPSDWARLIDLALQLKGTSSDVLNLLRLGVAVGASLDASDYNLMAEVAMRTALYGDALVAVRHGGKAPAAAAKAAADQKELPGLIAAAPNQDGKHNIVLAEDLYGYGRYAEAEVIARRALAKGFSPAGEANMLIGMSLTGQGKYAEAVSVFGQVSGTPAMMRGAHLWSRFAQQKSAPAPAATTAAAPTH